MCIKTILVMAALTAGVGMSCRRAPVPPRVDWTPDYAAFSGDQALAEAVALAKIVPRVANTPGAGRAAERLAGCFRAAGAVPRIEAFNDLAPGGTGIFRNVSVEIPGTGSNLVLLVAHFDTKGGIGDGFMGANDSGSGMGVLIELARLLAAGSPPPWTMRLVGLDGEECAVEYGPHDGLHGSRHEAARLRREGAASRVRAVILLDMVGDRDLTLTLPRNGTPELLQAAFDAARAAGVRNQVSLFEGTMLDDHVPFLAAGMAAVDLIDFQYGARPGENNYWHTLADTPDKLSAASLQHVGQIVLHMLAGLARQQ